MQPTAFQHVDIDPERCGGKPCIAGTRIRVWDVHVWHDLRGQSPEEIIVQFPQLSVADVYAALTYYHDHRAELEAEMRGANDWVDKLAQQQGPTRFTHMRDALTKDALADGDSVSS